MQEQEPQLVRRAQLGDTEAFGLLYVRYVEKIYAFIYYRTHHTQTAEDLTSVTFAKAMEKMPSYAAGKGSFSSWLYAIARNAVIDSYRTRKSDAPIEDVWDALSVDTRVPRDLDAKAKLEEVDEYLQTLSPATRSVIIMRLWDGLSFKEIADITGKSDAACKMAFSRGIRDLRSSVPLAAFLAFITNTL